MPFKAKYTFDYAEEPNPKERLRVGKECEKNLKLNVKLKNNQNSEDLLKLLNQNSRVIHFKEVIPSANDIFINSIEND